MKIVSDNFANTTGTDRDAIFVRYCNAKSFLRFLLPLFNFSIKGKTYKTDVYIH